MLESPAGGLDPPLDLVHLARQCLGDHELEADLLQLFRLQAPALMAQLSGFPPLSLELKAKIAHTLRGSALAVGAGRVASAAWRIEELASAADEPKVGGSERDRGAILCGRRGPHGNRPHSGLVAKAVRLASVRFRLITESRRPRSSLSTPLSAPLRLLYVGALFIAAVADRIHALPRRDAVFQGITLFNGENHFH